MANKVIEVENIKVNVVRLNDNDYICISDFTKIKDGNSTSDDIIKNWLRNRITLEFLGTWEMINNPNFNTVEFDGFRKEAGLHTFTLSVKKWCETNPKLAINSNIRDYATINELTVLSNLESHNAELIKEGKSKSERFEILSNISKYQLDILNNAEKIKLLGDVE